MKIKFFLFIFLSALLINPLPAQSTAASKTPALTAAAGQTTKSQIKGKVVGVADGDTITILDVNNFQYKIRLEGIDAPESKQDFGGKSKENLSNLVFGRQVTVITGKVDKYGRYVGKVLVGDVDANLEQIRAGFAWHYKQYADEQIPEDQLLYAAEETKAKKAKIGLWSMPNSVAPWEWRAGVGNPNLKGVPEGAVIGNKNSMLYHLRGCSGYAKVSPRNREIFTDAEDAEDAGYTLAGNCSVKNAKNSSPPKNSRTPARSSTPVRRSPAAPAKSRPKASRNYIRGPRGGCYYINSNGNKTYVDRSLCN